MGRLFHQQLAVFCDSGQCSQGIIIREEQDLWHFQSWRTVSEAPQALRDKFFMTLTQLEKKSPQGVYELDTSFDFSQTLDEFNKHNEKQSGEIPKTSFGSWSKQNERLTFNGSQWLIEEDMLAISKGLTIIPALKNKDRNSLTAFDIYHREMKRQGLFEFFSFSSWKIYKFLILFSGIWVMLVGFKKGLSNALAWAAFFGYILIVYVIFFIFH